MFVTSKPIGTAVDYIPELQRLYFMPNDYLSNRTSASIVSGPGILSRIFIQGTTSGVIKLWDYTSATGSVIMDATAVAAKDNFVIETKFGTGLFFQVITGTVTASIIYRINS